MKIIDNVNLPKMSPHDQSLSQFFHHSDQIKGPQPQKIDSEGSFDLGMALATAEPLETNAPKEVNISESIDGVERIFNKLKEFGGPNSASPYFNYNMGVAYHELGFSNEAIEQFKIAFKMEEKPFEALSMLGFCYWEKGMRDDAQQSFKRALGMENIPQERRLSAKYILSLLYQELGQKEIALGLLQEIATEDHAFLRNQEKIRWGSFL
jgi:tetratricopeptide (TPR) repeat protein